MSAPKRRAYLLRCEAVTHPKGSRDDPLRKLQANGRTRWICLACYRKMRAQ